MGEGHSQNARPNSTIASWVSNFCLCLWTHCLLSSTLTWKEPMRTDHSPFNFAALSAHQLLILLLTSVVCAVGSSVNTFVSFHIFRIEIFLIWQCEKIEGPCVNTFYHFSTNCLEFQSCQTFNPNPNSTPIHDITFSSTTQFTYIHNPLFSVFTRHALYHLFHGLF
jgi:hypothetical protein